MDCIFYFMLFFFDPTKQVRKRNTVKRTEKLGGSDFICASTPNIFPRGHFRKVCLKSKTIYFCRTLAPVHLFTCISKTNHTTKIQSYQHTAINGRTWLFPTNVARWCRLQSRTNSRIKVHLIMMVAARWVVGHICGKIPEQCSEGRAGVKDW